MRLLPPSLLLLIAARIEAQEQEQQQLPTAVRKMSPDQGEKFFHQYAAFPDAQQPRPPLVARRLAVYSDADARLLAANVSAELAFRPPFAPHSGADLEQEQEQEQPGRSLSDEEELRRSWLARELFRRARSARAILQGRQWSCPTGTESCSSIGFPNSCCATSETCVKITDTGLGSVGCCPNGSTCGGSITNCAPGNTPCASDIGGGCCIPGFVCQGVGCVRSSTAVVTQTSTSTTVSSAPASSTVVSTQTTTVSQTASDTGTSILPPVRPTSTTSSAGSGGDTSTNSFCPTGFYPCLASAGGGCCQTGRDCQTTSCPPITYTTIVNVDGVTVVVPASAVPSPTATGHCADQWFLCGKDAGNIAGCCPSGYSCGTASCFLATGGATAAVAKELPGRAATLRVRWEAGGAVLVATALILLA